MIETGKCMRLVGYIKVLYSVDHTVLPLLGTIMLLSSRY